MKQTAYLILFCVFCMGCARPTPHQVAPRVQVQAPRAAARAPAPEPRRGPQAPQVSTAQLQSPPAVEGARPVVVPVQPCMDAAFQGSPELTHRLAQPAVQCQRGLKVQW